MDLLALSNEMERFAGKNPLYMQGRKGAAFALNMQRLVNYSAIRKTLEACVKQQSEKDAPRQLHVRIMNAALQVSEIEVDCNRQGFAFQAIRNWADAGQKIVDRAASEATYEEAAKLQDGIYRQSMKNGLSTYLNLRWKYRQDRDAANVDATVDDAIASLCPTSASDRGCPAATKAELKAHGRAYLAGLRTSSEVRHDDASAAQEINGRIDELNRTLRDASKTVGEERGWFNNFVINTSDPDFAGSAKSFRAYTEAYNQAAGTGVGMLFMTDHMRDRAGGLREMDEDAVDETADRHKNTTRFKFKPHQRITAADIRQARDEAARSIIKQSVWMNNQATHQENQELYAKVNHTELFVSARENSIRKLSMTNPAAVGQILMSDPSRAGQVCRAINQVNATDDRDAMIKRGFMWGGIIVGGVAVVLTGGAALSGLLAAKGALAIGAGTLAGLKTTAVVAGTVGTVLGAVEAGYWGTEIVSLRGEISHLTGGALSGNSDPRAAADIRRASGELRDAVLAFSLSAAGSVADVAFATGFLRIASKTSRIEKAAELGGEARQLRALASNRGFQRVFTRFQGSLSADELGELAGQMSDIPDVLRTRIFRELEKMSPAQLKQTLKEGREALTRLCA